MKVIRTALRVLIRVIAVLGVPLAAALYFYSFHLPGIVEGQVLQALADLGLPNATARVAGIGLSGAVLTDLDLDGTGRVRAESVEVRYRLGEVIDGKVRGITVAGLTLTLRHADGALDLGPLGEIRTTGEAEGAAELPFQRIDLRACRLITEVAGEIRHFPVEGVLQNAGKGGIDFELTSRFEEKPVAIAGHLDTADLAVSARAESNGVTATVLYEQARDSLDFTLVGRRERLSLFLTGRHLLGEGLDVDVRGRVLAGKLTQTRISAAADQVAFDGRALRDLTVDLNGDMDHLTGTVSARCDLPAVGLDVGDQAHAFVGGAIGIYPTANPIRADLLLIEATVRDLDVAGFRGEIEAKLAGGVSEEGAALEIESARVTGQLTATPGPIEIRLGQPGTAAVALTEPLDWQTEFPEVIITAAPTIPGVGEADVHATAKVTATPKEIVAVVAEGSGIEGAVKGLGGLAAEGLVATFGGTVTLEPESMEVRVDGAAEGSADAIRGLGFEVGQLRFSSVGLLTREGDSLQFASTAPGRLTASSVRMGKLFAEQVSIECGMEVDLSPELIDLALPGTARIGAEAIHLDRLSAEQVSIESGLQLTMTPERIDVAVPGMARIESAAARYDEFALGKLALTANVELQALGGRFTGGVALAEPVTLSGPAMSGTLSSLSLTGSGQLGAGGDLAAEGRLTAVVGQALSEAGKLTVKDVRLDLPLIWGKPGSADPGKLNIGKMQVLGRTWPGPSLALVQEGQGVEFVGEWAATESALFKLEGDARLTSSGLISRTEFSAEPFYISAAGPLGSIIMKQTGASLTGVMSAKGRIVLDRGHLEPEVTVSLSQAEVSLAEDTIALGNVNAKVTIDSFPPTTPGGQRVTWDSARLGEIDLGAGLLDFQLEKQDTFAVEQIRCKTLPRGEFRTHSFRVKPAKPDLRIELYCEDVSLSRWLTLLAKDKASGEGLISGRLPLRIRTKPSLKVEFAPGYLMAAPGGWFEIHDTEALEALLSENIPSTAQETNYSDDLKDRVVQSLRNFEYSKLKFEIIQNEWNQTLRISTVGQGRKTPKGMKGPQGIDMTVNINGFDALVATILEMKLGLEDLFKGGKMGGRRLR